MCCRNHERRVHPARLACDNSKLRTVSVSHTSGLVAWRWKPLQRATIACALTRLLRFRLGIRTVFADGDQVARRNPRRFQRKTLLHGLRNPSTKALRHRSERKSRRVMRSSVWRASAERRAPDEPALVRRKRVHHDTCARPGTSAPATTQAKRGRTARGAAFPETGPRAWAMARQHLLTQC